MKPDDIIKVKHCAGPRGGMSCLREDAGKGTRRDEAGRYAHHRQAEVKPEFPDGTRDVAAMPAAWTLETTSQIALDCLNRGSGAHERVQKGNSGPAPNRPHCETGTRPSHDDVGRQLSAAVGMLGQQW